MKRKPRIRTKMSALTEAQVRAYIRDRTPEDNDLNFELTFTSEEITQAMESAARAFNSVAPYAIKVQADCLPTDTNVFFDGTAAALLRTLIHQLTRNDMSYQAGGVSVQVDSVRLQGIKHLEAQLTKEFKEISKEIKTARNYRGFFGSL